MNRFKIFHHIDQKTIDAMSSDYAPVFILSCGRSGSLFMHHLLSQSPQAQSYHEAFPNLMYFTDYAFHHQDQKETLKMMISAARMELILTAFNENKVYAESNQCLSFFVPALQELFPKARFVHLIRHPGDFVTSAARKGWHANDSIWESGRLRMKEPVWQGMSQIAKLSWVWEQTNRYLAATLLQLAPERRLTLKAEDLFSSLPAVRRVYDFCLLPVSLSDESLADFMKSPVNELEVHPDEPPNMKKNPGFPSYGAWTPRMKKELVQIAGPLASAFDYTLAADDERG